jgi:uncharacterized protein
MMMMTVSMPSSPSLDSLLALDRALLSATPGARAMNVAALEGLITALVIGPRVLPPSAWLPWVWDPLGARLPPSFESPEAGQALIVQIHAVYDQAARFWRGEPSDFTPVYVRLQDPSQVVAWCQGFGIGIRLAYKDWAPLQVGAPLLFEPISACAEARHVAEQAAALVPNVLTIAAHWRAHRELARSGARAGPAPLRRDAPKLNRNDPCHCGSGLKFKKCHGA